MKNPKCHLCEKELKTTFLDKIIGTTITNKGKKFYICSGCQKEHKNSLKEKL